MSSLKPSPAQLICINRARIERGWTIDSEEWLIAASKILHPDINWDRSDKYAVSTSTWKRFLRGEPIRPQAYKAFCQVLGLDWQQTIAIELPQKVTLSNKCDWGEAPDVSVLIGRDAEIATLKQWIAIDRVRTISVVGIGGIGKTSVVAKLAQEIAGEFDYLIWRSLRAAPSVEKIVADCIKLIARDLAIDLPETLGDRITTLIDLLRLSRCLLVFDNAESILASGVLSGNYHPQFTGYGDLFRRIATSRHQSCSIITSREQLQDLRKLQDDFAPNRSMQLVGLQQGAVKILKDKGIVSSIPEIENLIAHYHGNPLALKMVADIIKSTFDRDITEFLQGSTVFGGIEQLLTEQFDRLSTIEKSVIYWLAIHRESVSAKILALDIIGESLASISAALDSLLNRSLIQPDRDGFTLQSIVMEYVTDRFVEQIDRELSSDRFELLRTHAIIQTTAKDYIREIQQRLLLAPILDRLTKYESSATIEQKFRVIISYFRTKQLDSTANLFTGYAIGNIINLLLGLKIDLAGYDFSHLKICQAYLVGVELVAVNFSYSHLDRTIFSQSLGSIFSVAFSPDSRIFYNCSEEESIKLGDLKTSTCVQPLTLPKPYRGMNITGVSGLSTATRASLISLGAISIDLA